MRITLASLLLFTALPGPQLQAQTVDLGGSIRGYQFFRLQPTPLLQRRDVELWLLRLESRTQLNPRLSLEAHGILTLLSPPFREISRIALSDSGKFLPLGGRLGDHPEVELVSGLDRLNLQLELDRLRVTVGRQAFSWGVGFFWPALDLFAPFAPGQIDREYKAGVDAVRVTVPAGLFSEVEFIGASLGPSAAKDGAAGVLLRLHTGPVELGLTGGHFHGDTVAGTFVTTNLQGSILRGELVWTRSGDPEDAARNRNRFWRGSVGFDRQLTAELGLTLEAAWNGFGTSDPARYPQFLTADRLRRGEVNALARVYTGASLLWLLHPLWTFQQALLVNWNDGSTLWIPSLTWSTGNNSELLLGAQLGTGPELGPDLLPKSEYGATPTTLFAALKFFF